MDKTRSILSRFWRGECSLAVSFWVFYVGLTIAAQCILPLTRGIIEGRTFDPTRIFADAIAGFVLLFALGVYQWVGLWRAADRAVARERAGGRHSLAGWSVRVVVALAMANFGRVVVTDVAPGARELYEIAFRGDPSVPPFAMQASPDGTQLRVSGGFQYGLTSRFLEQARTLPALRTVHLSSIGGRLGEALHLAREIRLRGLDTYVSDGCYSACTVAYAAGRRRFLRDGAELGYHTESFLGAALAERQRERRPPARRACRRPSSNGPWRRRRSGCGNRRSPNSPRRRRSPPSYRPNASPARGTSTRRSRLRRPLAQSGRRLFCRRKSREDPDP